MRHELWIHQPLGVRRREVSIAKRRQIANLLKAIRKNPFQVHFSPNKADILKKVLNRSESGGGK
jgi:hypothetical protein